MKNAEIASILENIATYLEMENEQVFKVRAYEKAARSIEALDRQLKDIYIQGGVDALMEISGVGKSIAEKLEELLKTGRMKYYEQLKKKAPVDIEGLTAIERVGPKRIKIFYKKLHVKNVGDLERVAKAGKVRKLAGFGEKSELDIIRGIEFLKKSTGRFVLGHILSSILEIEARLRSLKQVEKAVIGGSVRRRKETIGDADILVVSDEPKAVTEYFTTMPEVIQVIGKGSTKCSVKLNSGLNVDMRIIPKKSFGAAWQYFTGNKDHNVKLRQIAINKGYKLNEYGVFKGQKQVAGETEEEVYEILGLKWMPPELRENTGEIEAAAAGKLPLLVEYGSLKGDLQMHSDWTDGMNTIKEMAEGAREAGLKYICVTDHTKSLAMTGGLDEARLLKQKEEIEKINDEISGITILAGAEVNILKNGKLDISDKVLRQLDVVGVAVHSHFNLTRSEQTLRVINAINNENVDILFHPTGRIIQQREAIDIDIQKVIDAAKRTGTVMEIDSYPDRMDLSDEHVKLAVNTGVKLSIDSDGHNTSHFKFLEFGISNARRGWAKASDVVNTLPLEKMLKQLK